MSEAAAASSDDTPKFTTLYFGFASNLAPKTLKQRCPDSLFAGLARLDGWRWIINTSGYANIIPSPEDHVYGSLYFLTSHDEAMLDILEEVPWQYQKHRLSVVRVGPGVAEGGGQVVEVMTHVDSKRLEQGTIERDYIVWVNRAIDGGLKHGVPAEYMDKYLRPYTPQDNEIRDIEMIRTKWDVRMIPTGQNKPMPVEVENANKQ